MHYLKHRRNTGTTSDHAKVFCSALLCRISFEIGMYGEVAIFVVSHVPYSNILMVLIVDVVIGATEMEITNNGSVILRCKSEHIMFRLGKNNNRCVVSLVSHLSVLSYP